MNQQKHWPCYLLKLGKVSTDTACAFIYHQPKLPKALKRVKEQVDMSYLSGKITDYIIKMGVISDELYEVYQYGFQIGMEMFSCFAVCLVIAIYLHTILEFAVFTYDIYAVTDICWWNTYE